ncbi:HET domain-containing protein [Colletotrichum acutatum]
MRLLNVETRKVREFFIDVPRYVILSHTWGAEEVTFQDLDYPYHIKKQGYAKIDGLCCLAAKEGFEWVWIDTCCIDETSSAELSEAINSMYQWYKGASICYAYLEDVQPGDDLKALNSQFGTNNQFDKILAVRLVHTDVADEYIRPRSDGLVFLSWQSVKKCQNMTIHIEKGRGPSVNRNTFWHIRHPRGYFGLVRIQHPDHSGVRLVDVAPEQFYHKRLNSVFAGIWRGDRCGRILLYYKQDPVDDKQESDNDGDGFIVVLDERSPLSAFCSLEMEPPPFVCYTLPMPKGERLEQLLSRDKSRSIHGSHVKYRDLSKFRNRFSLKAGIPQAKIEREHLLDHEHFLVKVFYTKATMAPQLASSPLILG